MNNSAGSRTTQIADYLFLGDMGLRTRVEIGLLFLASGMLLVVFLPNHPTITPKIPRHFWAMTYLEEREIAANKQETTDPFRDK